MSPPSGPSRHRSLERLQHARTVLLARVERAAARLERRKRKLAAMESAVAELERRIAEPDQHPGKHRMNRKGLRHAQLIFNPSAGPEPAESPKRLAAIVRALRASGIEPDIGIADSGDSARELAHAAVRHGTSLVVVAAGDGTVSTIASVLMETPVVLGLVPVGTMNNLARSLGIPLDIEAACLLIGMETSRHIDVGRVRADGTTAGSTFLEFAGVGLAAVGSLAGETFEKRRWRKLPRALWRFFETPPGKMQLELDGVRIEVSTQVITVCNSPLMGSNLLAAPEAKMDDGWLDISYYEGMGDAALFKHFLAASAHRADGLEVRRARRVRITTEAALNTSSHLSLPAGHHVLDIEVVPGALAMIVGNGMGLTHPVEAAPSAPTYAHGPTTQTEPHRDSAHATPESQL